MFEWWWAYLALGAFVGFFAGLLGIGGGAAMVPVLAFVYAAKGFDASQVVHLALGTSMATILFTSVSSVRAHHSHARHIHFRTHTIDFGNGLRSLYALHKTNRFASFHKSKEI